MDRDVTLLCLIRHGTTSWNAAGRLQGRKDTPLSRVGERQAHSIKDEMQRLQMSLSLPRWHAIYSSPLKRARHTSQPVADQLGLTVNVQPDLIERAFGALEGMSRSESEAQFPSWRTTPGLVPGLEDEKQLRSRARRVFDQIAGAHRGENVIVVSHGAFLNAFLSVITAGRAGTGKTHFENGAYTLVRLDHSSRTWTVPVINVTSHLQDIH